MARRKAREQVEVARRLVSALGGRYSAELGIDVDAGEAEVERWFVAATLFGTRISAAIAERTFRVLDEAGIVGIAAARDRSWDDLVGLLDRGGYARYDFRTATRLQAIAEAVHGRYGGEVSAIAARADSPAELEAALDGLPGWGPVTVTVFLRELRGVWPHAAPPLDERARRAGVHLGLVAGNAPGLADLQRLARDARLDVRDLESALVRLALAHGPGFGTCPGGCDCSVIAAAEGAPERARPVGPAGPTRRTRRTPPTPPREGR